MSVCDKPDTSVRTTIGGGDHFSLVHHQRCMSSRIRAPAQALSALTHAIYVAESRATRLVLFHSNAAGNPILRPQNSCVPPSAKRAEDRALCGRTVVFWIHAGGTDSGFSMVDGKIVVEVCYLLYLCAPHRCYWAVLREMHHVSPWCSSGGATQGSVQLSTLSAPSMAPLLA